MAIQYRVDPSAFIKQELKENPFVAQDPKTEQRERPLNVLLLGSGGRESALAWKMAQSPRMGHLFIAPGNGGTGAFGTNIALKPTDFDAVAGAIDANAIDLVVVGNEDPLVAGLRDYLAKERPGVLVVGPGADGARLEGSKEWAKEFMTRHGVPTARYRSFTAATAAEGRAFLGELRPPYVLKADGLAAGKGVLIIDDLEEARRSLDEMLSGMFGNASATVVVEEFLSGIECSVFVLTDGRGGYRILPVAKDYKRVGEGDKGPNTGGMGAVSPVVFADDAFMAKVEERIVRPTVDGLIADGIDYRGFIFLGLINVGGAPMVIEYNARMGDPETEVVMLRIASDLLPALEAAARGDLGDVRVDIDPRAATTVIAVSGGYPGKYAKGLPIAIADGLPEGVTLFHAGTTASAGGLVTSGGRVIACSAIAPTVEEALAASYAAVDAVSFENKNFRRDIGRDLLALG